MCLAVAVAPHRPQDASRGVLEGHVEVRHGVRRKGGQQSLVDVLGLQVEQAQPGWGRLKRGQLREQALKPAPARDAVARRVLADEHELARAARSAARAAASTCAGGTTS